MRVLSAWLLSSLVLLGFTVFTTAFSSVYVYPRNCRLEGKGFCLEGAKEESDFDSAAPPLDLSPPRKICLIVEPTPFTHVSGYSNRFNELLRYLSKAGDHVEILTVDTKTKPSDLPKKRFGFRIQHTQGFTFPLYNHISLTFDLPELKGAKIMDRFRPDLIHVSSPGFIVYAAIFYARIMRIPLLMSYHTHLPAYAKNYFSFWPWNQQLAWSLLRWVHSRADLTLVTSPQMAKELSDNGIPRVDVWRKGIDTIKFNPEFKCQQTRKAMTNNKPDDFLMVYIGRLGDEKRLKDLKPILQQLPNSRLCIVGGGPQEAELHKHFQNTNTIFTGQLSGDELSKHFASADVFVMPSDSETLGFVVLESMASGVPVVAANAGGIPNLIQDQKDGFLVTPGNTTEYLHRLKQLQKDHNFRNTMGIRAREEAERWSWEAATSILRNEQYEKTLVNFHSRAFGGFQNVNPYSLTMDGSKQNKITPKRNIILGILHFLKVKVQNFLQRILFPGFRQERMMKNQIP